MIRNLIVINYTNHCGLCQIVCSKDNPGVNLLYIYSIYSCSVSDKPLTINYNHILTNSKCYYILL